MTQDCVKGTGYRKRVCATIGDLLFAPVSQTPPSVPFLPPHYLGSECVKLQKREHHSLHPRCEPSKSQIFCPLYPF
jgi:hypothetical protein